MGRRGTSTTVEWSRDSCNCPLWSWRSLGRRPSRLLDAGTGKLLEDVNSERQTKSRSLEVTASHNYLTDYICQSIASRSFYEGVLIRLTFRNASYAQRDDFFVKNFFQLLHSNFRLIVWKDFDETMNDFFYSQLQLTIIISRLVTSVKA
jgi:hypothetical protein